MSKPDRIPPQALEMEQAVLGSVLIEPSCLPVVKGALWPAAFYRKEHGELYTVLCGMAEKNVPIDLMSVQEACKASGLLDRLGGAPGLLVLTDAVASAANVEHYAGIVRDRATRRFIISSFGTLCEKAYDPDVPQGDLIGMAHTATDKAMRGAYRNGHSHTFLALAQAIYDQAVTGQAHAVGMPTGCPKIDAATDGLQGGTVTVLAARPSVGKSALGMRWAMHGAANGFPTLFFSYEMTPDQIGRRAIAAASGLSTRQLKNGAIREEDVTRLGKGCSVLSQLPVTLIDAEGMGLDAIETEIRRNKGVKTAIIDYLQLVPAPKADSREQAVAALSKGLKSIARRLDVAVVVLAQLNRAVTMRPDGEPELHDLRESGSIEQDADHVVFLWNAVKDTWNVPEYKVYLKLAKNRHGWTGKYVYLFKRQTFEFIEVETA